jgi:hypothetical protein
MVPAAVCIVTFLAPFSRGDEESFCLISLTVSGKLEYSPVPNLNSLPAAAPVF